MNLKKRTKLLANYRMNAMEKSDNKCDCIHGLILLYFVYLHIGFKFLIIHENSIKEIA